MGVWPQPLETQAQAKVQLEKFQYPMGAKGELLGPGHRQGRPLATPGAEEKDKWVWQRHPPMWAAKLQQQGMGPWHEPEAPKGGSFRFSGVPDDWCRSDLVLPTSPLQDLARRHDDVDWGR